MSSRGWGIARAVALALAVALLSPVSPIVLVCVPLAVLLLAFHGRSPMVAAGASLILVAVFWGIGEARSPLWFAERAWALLLAGGFVLAALLAPRRGTLVRSIAALGVAFGSVGIFALLRPDALNEVDWWIGSQLSRAAHVAYEWFGAPRIEALGDTMRSVVRVQMILYPALLALASLAALGVASYAVTRLRGATEGLAPLREFRFSDHLVWVLVAGLVLFLLPAGELAARVGENAMVFMVGLYLVRGIAVLVWLGAALVTSAWAAVLWTALAILLYPVAVGAALLIGLSDTWLDLRARLQRTPGGRM